MMRTRGVRFIDSLKFFDMKLTDLPNMFNLPEMKKDYFPYLINFNEYFNYKGPYPPSKCYIQNEMNMEERQKFKTWYTVKINCNAEFCFRTEIEEYCRSDVEILRRACGKFRGFL